MVYTAPFFPINTHILQALPQSITTAGA